MIDLQADAFTLLGLPRKFSLDENFLDARYRELQLKVHPDRFVQAGESDRLRAMQSAVRVNEAYQVLKRPLSRAQCLLELLRCSDQSKEVSLSSSSSARVPQDVLLEQMEWREAFDEAKQASDHHEYEHLLNRLGKEIAEAYRELGRLLDDSCDYSAASDRLMRLQFFEKMRSELTDALDHALDSLD